MISDSHYTRFLSNLPERVRVQLPDLWQAFSLCFPGEVGSGQGRHILASIIERMVEEGFQLPSTRVKANFDRIDHPPLPKWLNRPKKEKVDGFQPANHLWAEELSFLSNQRHLRNHELWLRLDQWFKTHRNKEIVAMPLRERSYEIFRDEKALDGLRKTTPFRSGEISLETLGCFIVYEPLPYELGPPSAKRKPALVVENQTTYWTIAQWNKTAGRYACVIYGAGNKFSAAWEWMLWKREELGFSEVKYFGDIDVTGIDIAIRAGSAISAADAFAFSLDEDLYRLALTAERGRDLPSAQGRTQFSSDILIFFPEEMREEIRELLLDGCRIPQETVTTERLNQTMLFYSSG